MNYKLLIIITTLLFSIQCTKDDLFGTQVEHSFFLETEDALLPVVVEGNTASKTFLLVVHGGPGGSGLSYNQYDAFDQIESKYAVVYYDQRCAGNAQGNCEKESLDIESHILDLDRMVELLKFRYGNDISLIMLGHSWGGTLTMSYLVEGEFQDKLNAAIIVGGPHNFIVYAAWVKSMIQFYAFQQIDLQNNATGWNELLTDIAGAYTPTVENITSTNVAAQQAQIYMSNVDSVNTFEISFNDILGSIFGADGTGRFINITNGIISGSMWDELASYNLSNKLNNITLPTALYWGTYDFVVPPAYGQEIYELIGSTSKEFILFESSDHSPMLSELDAFNQSVKSFIDQHR